MSRVIQGVRLASIWFCSSGWADQSSAIAPAICGVAMEVPSASIGAIGRVAGRASACARSSDIRFYPVAAIGSDRTATAKESSGIGAGVKSTDCVGGRIKRRRI